MFSDQSSSNESPRFKSHNAELTIEPNAMKCLQAVDFVEKLKDEFNSTKELYEGRIGPEKTIAMTALLKKLTALSPAMFYLSLDSAFSDLINSDSDIELLKQPQTQDSSLFLRLSFAGTYNEQFRCEIQSFLSSAISDQTLKLLPNSKSNNLFDSAYSHKTAAFGTTPDGQEIVKEIEIHYNNLLNRLLNYEVHGCYFENEIRLRLHLITKHVGTKKPDPQETMQFLQVYFINYVLFPVIKEELATYSKEKKLTWGQSDALFSIIDELQLKVISSNVQYYENLNKLSQFSENTAVRLQLLSYYRDLISRLQQLTATSDLHKEDRLTAIKTSKLLFTAIPLEENTDKFIKHIDEVIKNRPKKEEEINLKKLQAQMHILSSNIFITLIDLVTPLLDGTQKDLKHKLEKINLDDLNSVNDHVLTKSLLTQFLSANEHLLQTLSLEFEVKPQAIIDSLKSFNLKQSIEARASLNSEQNSPKVSKKSDRKNEPKKAQGSHKKLSFFNKKQGSASASPSHSQNNSPATTRRTKATFPRIKLTRSSSKGNEDDRIDFDTKGQVIEKSNQNLSFKK